MFLQILLHNGSPTLQNPQRPKRQMDHGQPLPSPLPLSGPSSQTRTEQNLVRRYRLHPRHGIFPFLFASPLLRPLTTSLILARRLLVPPQSHCLRHHNPLHHRIHQRQHHTYRHLTDGDRRRKRHDRAAHTGLGFPRPQGRDIRRGEGQEPVGQGGRPRG